MEASGTSSQHYSHAEPVVNSADTQIVYLITAKQDEQAPTVSHIIEVKRLFHMTRGSCTTCSECFGVTYDVLVLGIHPYPIIHAVVVFLSSRSGQDDSSLTEKCGASAGHTKHSR